MRNRDPKLAQWKPIQRYSFALLGLTLIAMGVLNLFAGRLHYGNYWGAPVFTPFVIFIGALVLIGAFRYRKEQK
jgi:hypothetical protein